MGKIIRNGIEFSSTVDTANNISYDNSLSGLEATTTQKAIDEVVDNVSTLNESLGGVSFGIDGDGNYGYYGADDSFIPFSSSEIIDFEATSNDLVPIGACVYNYVSTQADRTGSKSAVSKDKVITIRNNSSGSATYGMGTLCQVNALGLSKNYTVTVDIKNVRTETYSSLHRVVDGVDVILASGGERPSSISETFTGVSSVNYYMNASQTAFGGCDWDFTMTIK